MVKQSRCEFRMLARKFGVDIAYTPMVVTEDLANGLPFALDDLITCPGTRLSLFIMQNENPPPGDNPLIVQFASSDSTDLLAATKAVYPGCDGVDLNCGCPQKFAFRRNFGAALLSDPETIRVLIRDVRNALPDKVCGQGFTVSAKIRVLDDIRESVELCRKLEKAGVSFIGWWK